MPDRNGQLDQAEKDIAATVADALTATADEFADAVHSATELVAARFSVGRIGRMWGNRVRGVVRRLLGVSQAAAEAAAEDVGEDLPDGWDNLPGRYDDERELPVEIASYVEVTEHLLRAVGDRLAEAARRELAAGLDAGEDIEQLRARLRGAFTREGSHLGPGRERRVARTEASRAWNMATLAAARAATGPDKPVVKQWITRHDTRVRESHDDVDAQLRLLDEPFTVAGVRMDAPGDPTAPASLVVNCRCRLGVAPELRASTNEMQAPQRGHVLESEESSVEPDQIMTAAAGTYTGAMIALLPSAEDAERLALEAPGSEPPDQLHLTLYYLGEGADWDTEHRDGLVAGIRERLPDDVIHARAFGANHWNADGESPCWVWSVGDDPDRPTSTPGLEVARWAAVYALEDMHRQPDLPAQHTPWQPHVCAAYTRSPALLTALTQRLGPIRFDRLRVAFAGEYTDIPLAPGVEASQMDDDTLTTTTPAWSTPGDTGLAFEDTETGDGRVFRPGSLYWAAPGPWPLQYADEMLVGHQGAELAGSIQTIGREGDRITGTGVLYANRPAGADALTLLQEEAPLGISVDLDDVSVEFVDRTTSSEDEGQVVLFASLPSASMLRLDDGSWMVTASATTEWTASGTYLSRTAKSAQLVTGKDGVLSAAAVREAFAGTGVLTAAAGDRDDQDLGTVVHRESSGDLLMRVTRARLRGATLVAMPAYDRARIVLDARSDPSAGEGDEDKLWAGTGPSPAHMRVVQYVKGSPIAVGAREVASACSMKMDTVRGHLSRAAKAGRLVRLAPGLYVGPSSEGPQDDATAAALAGNTDDGETDSMRDLVASAWTAMQDLPPMPAAWFREPTAAELPPGSGGVHCDGGRIYGWVAQAGVPHAGYPGKKLTIESLGKLDLTHFLRARFSLDDGSTVKAGAFTMDVPHRRDGAECEDAACQFDDSRTVAGIVTVGQNAGGLWFSGAAGPWLSDWDRAVFRGCQPSYHLKNSGGRWELRAVLSVPVPGHSSPLLATAVAERSNLALAASAAGVLDWQDTSGQLLDNSADVPGFGSDTHTRPMPDLPGQRPDIVPDNSADVSGRTAPPSRDVDAVASALLSSVPFLDVLVTALDRHQERRDAVKEETARLAASVIAPAREEIAAGHTTTVTEGIN
ncbi:phage minor head protein [Streptomyces niveus]|uniref:phage minor head protein n=1 Tax=Streptomyces niveus TaxID=193462 RepID=UPI0036D411CE